MTRAPNLLTEQLARVALRSWLLLHGVASGVFWALFLTVWTLLSGAGLGWVGWVMLAGYVVVAAPFLIIQLVLIADLLAYVVIGRIFAYPAIDRIVSDYAKADATRARGMPWPAHVILFLADASPLSSFAMGSMIVLARMPQSVHGTLQVQELKRREIYLERAVYAEATARLGFARATA